MLIVPNSWDRRPSADTSRGQQLQIRPLKDVSLIILRDAVWFCRYFRLSRTFSQHGGLRVSSMPFFFSPSQIQGVRFINQNRKVPNFTKSPGSSCCFKMHCPIEQIKDPYFSPVLFSKKRKKKKKKIKIQLTCHFSSDFSPLFSLTFSLTLSSKVPLFQDALSLTFTLLGKWSKKKKRKKKEFHPLSLSPWVPLQKSASAKCVYINVNACTQHVCSSEMRIVCVCALQTCKDAGRYWKCSLFNDWYIIAGFWIRHWSPLWALWAVPFSR